MFSSYLKITFRTLLKSKVYSAINLGGLALGIASCILIGLFIWDELSTDLFHQNYNNIYRITEKQKQGDAIYSVAQTPGPLAPALQTDFPVIQNFARVGRWGGLLSDGDRALEAEQMLVVDPGFFKMFNFPLRLGNPTQVFNDPHEVIFTEAMAERFFGPDWQFLPLIGREIVINNDQTLRLVAIAKNPPAQSHLQFDALLPFAFVQRYDEWGYKWGSNNYHTYLLLKPGTNGAAFSQTIKKQLAKYKDDQDTQLGLQALGDIYLHSKFDFGTDWGFRSDYFYIKLALIVGLIILFIAAINFINLATARSIQKAKEVGVRKSVGAGRGSLIFQFLGESAIMISMALFLGLLLAQFLLPLLNVLTDKTLNIPFLNTNFWLVLIIFTLVLSFLTGVYPAFFLSSFRPAKVLKGVFDVSSGKRFRQTLVIGQFTLSITLAIGTLVVYQQLRFMQHTKLGFDQSNLLYVNLKDELQEKSSLFKNVVSQIPGVAQASVATSNLVNVGNSSTAEWEGQSPQDEFLMSQVNVDADFVPTTGLTVICGRNFSAKITADTSALSIPYLINEAAMKRMGWNIQSALGKKIKFYGQEGKVIGVVKDFHFQNLHQPIEPLILRYRPLESYFTLLIKTDANSTEQILSQVQKAYKKLLPLSPFSYGFIDQDLQAQYLSEQRVGRIMLSFAFLAILVSCLGLFGLVVFSTEQKVKEIGIRKVLGAGIVNIAYMLGKDFTKLVLFALVLASPLAWYFSKLWLQDFAYQIDLSWWIFAVVGFGALLIAILTVGFQSIKAALDNPVKSLRSE
jgi:ABC-type antimicrobial peptide transport system permease subunit